VGYSTQLLPMMISSPKVFCYFFFVVAVIHLLKLLFSFIDIGIFNVVRFPNAACVGSNANVSISFRCRREVWFISWATQIIA